MFFFKFNYFTLVIENVYKSVMTYLQLGLVNHFYGRSPSREIVLKSIFYVIIVMSWFYLLFPQTFDVITLCCNC